MRRCFLKTAGMGWFGGHVLKIFGDWQGVRASGAGSGIDAKKKAQKFSRAVSGESLFHVLLFGCRGSLSLVCKAACAC